MNHEGRYFKAVERAKLEIVNDALEKHRWNIVEAARWLGVQRNAVHDTIRRHGLRRPADAEWSA